MKRTSIALADGRELIDFDIDDDADRGQLDQRTLDPVPHRSQLRYDVMLGQWVMIAAHRQRRTFQPSPADCPLCPTRPGAPTEIPAPTYDVAVFENRFPALAMTGRNGRPIDETRDFLPVRVKAAAGIGRCEVVCFTSDHDASFAELTPKAADLVVEAWIDRTTELSALPGIEQVFCFENRGKEIGVTIDHPHGQIYAYPFLTPRTANVLRNAEAYRAGTSRSLVDDMLASEQAAGVRVVARTDHWTAFVPFAARWPYELPLYPNRRVPDLASLTPGARAEFAPLYLDLFAVSIAYSTSAFPTSPPSTKRPFGADATSWACTSNCSRCVGQQTDSSTSPEVSRPWTRTPTTSAPKTPHGAWPAPDIRSPVGSEFDKEVVDAGT